MEEDRQLVQIDRKRMRSISVSIRCDIRFKSSFGSSDQSAFVAIAMKDALPLLRRLGFYLTFSVGLVIYIEANLSY